MMRSTPKSVLSATAILALAAGPAAADAVPASRSGQAAGAVGEEQVEEALLGFDPVELIRGEEVFGDEGLAVVHDGYRYLFSSDENRELFLSDPERWGIQLGGLCARMGGTTGGDPELWTVHDGRIYVFGANDCLRRFTGSPEGYLPPDEGPSLAERAEAGARERGQWLLRAAVEAHGGAAALDAVERYAESGTVLDGARAGAALGWKVAWGSSDGSSAGPDRFRREREISIGMLADVARGDEAFYSLPDGRTEALRTAEGKGLAAIFKHHPLWILKARSRPGFVVTAAGGRPVAGDGESLDVEFDGLRMTVSLGADGRIREVARTGRGPEGVWGRVVETWSDYREIDGLALPHRRARTFDGEPWPGSRVELVDVEVNGSFGADVFRR